MRRNPRRGRGRQRERVLPEKSRALDLLLVCLLGLVAVLLGFTWTLKGRHEMRSAELRRELADLDRLRDLAADETLRSHIARDREYRPREGSPVDFESLLVNLANKRGLTIDQRRRQQRDLAGEGLVKDDFILTLRGVELEDLTSFLFELEESWVGAAVEKLDLTWQPRTELWKATASIALLHKKDPVQRGPARRNS